MNAIDPNQRLIETYQAIEASVFSLISMLGRAWLIIIALMVVMTIASTFFEFLQRQRNKQANNSTTKQPTGTTKPVDRFPLVYGDNKQKRTSARAMERASMGCLP